MEIQEPVSLIVHPDVKRKPSTSEQLRPIVEEMEEIRQRTHNTLFGRARGEVARSSKYLEGNSEQVRDNIFDILAKISVDTRPNSLDHYDSLGLTFLPTDSDQTHPLIRVRKKTPQNPVSHDKPILSLVHDALDNFYAKKYESQHSSSAKTISLFKRNAYQNRATTRGEMLQHVFRNGKLPSSESVKIHETAHCSNAFGFDYKTSHDSIATKLGYEILHMRYAVSAHTMHEIHSMVSEYVLAGDTTNTPITSIKDIATYSLVHPNVSGYKYKGLTTTEIHKMARNHLAGDVSNLPEWYLERHKKAEVVLKNVLRTITTEETIGKAGTSLGRQRNKEKMMQMKNGRMKNWEKRIVRQAKRKGLVARNMRLDKALEKIDEMTEKTIDKLDTGALQVRFALSAGIITSLKDCEDLPELVSKNAQKANLLVEKARQIQQTEDY